MQLHPDVMRVCVAHPHMIAIEDEFGEWTYARLAAAVNGIRETLGDCGVDGSPVIIWSPKRAEVVAAVLAVHGNGDIACILDEAQPLSRLVEIATISGARRVLTVEANVPSLQDALASHPTPVEIIALETAAGRDAAPRPTVERADSDAAYLYLTSGSTGLPKGVLVAHGTLRRFVRWGTEQFGVESSDVFGNCSSLAAAITMLDTYVPLVSGARLRLVPRSFAITPHRYADAFVSTTIWLSVPSILALMCSQGGLLDYPANSGPRAIGYFGESASIDALRKVRSWTTAGIYNMYGASEAVGCFFHEVTDNDLDAGLIPIGRPSLGNSASLFEPNEEGVGQLLVDGPSVFLGYVGRPAHSGAYATADLARIDSKGDFLLVGRTGLQRDIRGQRIHLGEVESFAQSIEGVADAASEIYDGPDGKTLGLIVERSADISELDIRRAFADGLPRHARPSTIGFVGALPRLANGKLDRPQVLRVLEGLLWT